MLNLLSGRLSSLFVSSGTSMAARPISMSSLVFKDNNKDESSSNKKSSSSDESDENSLKKMILTEELPPIPPNLGFPGDENVRRIFEMRRIRQSFKYGTPPHLVRTNNAGPMIIRLLPITHCRNRHFFRIAVTRANYDKNDGYIEDIGSIDPLPNKDNKIMVAINFERLKYYLGRQVPVKGVVGQILGLSGFLPVHPRSYLRAYRNRVELEKRQQEAEKKAQEEKAALEAAQQKTAASPSPA